MVIFWPLWVYCAVAVTTVSTWIFWLVASIGLGILQVIFVTYQFIMIAGDVLALTFLKTYQVITRSRIVQTIFFFSKGTRHSRLKTSRRQQWKQDCEKAESYSDFLSIGVREPKGPEPNNHITHPSNSLLTKKGYSRSMNNLSKLQTLDEEKEGISNAPLSPPRRPLVRSLSSGNKIDSFWKSSMTEEDIDPMVIKDLGPMTAQLLLSTTERLREARKAFLATGESNLALLLSGVVKRNHLTLEDLLVTNARSVAYNGQHEFSANSRKAIASYYDEVSKGLDLLAETIPSPAPSINAASQLRDRITLVRKMKQNVGRTALMLSGGGAQANYHLGVVRALIDSGLYNDIHVISGTSGGSVTAASCAMFTPQELFEKVCIKTVSTDYEFTGEMKRRNIRWFPKIMDVATYWLKHRLMIDSEVSSSTGRFFTGSDQGNMHL
jgi:hypothetical protein